MFATRSDSSRRRALLCLLICSIAMVSSSEPEGSSSWRGFASFCSKGGNSSASCHGIKIVRRIVQELLDRTSRQKSIAIVDGVSLVDVGENNTGGSQRGFGSFLNFLEGRELRVTLQTLLPDNLVSALRESLPTDKSRQMGGGGGGGGGGGKKGDNNNLMLALMMGKLLAALGFGALAALTMKAMLVSALALMLSLILAVKKLAHHGHDHHLNDYHVVYAQEVGHPHRRRRAIDDDLAQLPYRGHAKIIGDLRASR